MDDNDVTEDIRSVLKHSMRNDHLLTTSLLEEALNSYGFLLRIPVGNPQQVARLSGNSVTIYI